MIVPLVVVSGMIVMAMIVASKGVSRGVIVSGVSVVAVCRVIMLRFKTGFVQPVLPDVSGLRVDQGYRCPVGATKLEINMVAVVIDSGFTSD